MGEENVGESGTAFVAGLDESGVGSIAGPLIVACVILPHPLPEGVSLGERAGLRARDLKGWWPLREVRDSKTIERGRCLQLARSLAEWVGENGGVVAAGAASVQEREECGEKKAWGLAAARASRSATALLRHLTGDPATFPAVLVVDGSTGVPGYPRAQAVLPRADGEVFEAAIAGILARGLRLESLQDLEADHPGWSFVRNGGMPTEDHLARIRLAGRLPCHVAPAVEGVLAKRSRRESTRRLRGEAA